MRVVNQVRMGQDRYYYFKLALNCYFYLLSCHFLPFWNGDLQDCVELRLIVIGSDFESFNEDKSLL